MKREMGLQKQAPGSLGDTEMLRKVTLRSSKAQPPTR